MMITVEIPHGSSSGSCAQVSLLYAALLNYNAEFAMERTRFFAAAFRGRPEVRREVGHRVELKYRGHKYVVRVFQLDCNHFRAVIDKQLIDLELQSVEADRARLSLNARQYQLRHSVDGSEFTIGVDGETHVVAVDDGYLVRAAAPAVVVSVAVKPGDLIAVGDRIAVLEAMKLEMEISSPVAGRIREVLTIANAQVGPGTPLVRMDSATTKVSDTQKERLNFVALQTPQPANGLRAVRQLLLGYDVPPDPPKLEPILSEDLCPEFELLNIFLDFCELFRHSPKLRHGLDPESPSSESCFFAYLHMPDTELATLPAPFSAALRAALEHYGLRDLARSADRENALFWIYKSHSRIDEQLLHILRILRGILNASLEHGYQPDGAWRGALDRLIDIARDISPELFDVAYELRYQCFDRPLFEETRRATDNAVQQHLDHLAAHPNDPDLAKRKRWLIDCPRQLARMFAARFESAPEHLQQLMLEVMISRYYCSRPLAGFHALPLQELCCVTTSYEDGGSRVHVLAMHCDVLHLSAAVNSLQSAMSLIPEQDRIVLDVLCWVPAADMDTATVQQKVHEFLSQVQLSRVIERIVIAVSAVNRHPSEPEILYFTYEPSKGHYEEVPFFRGAHPMSGDRLHLWRLANFNLERLPSNEDVYLLHATAKSNPKDERLFAVIEVRDMTAVRGRGGELLRLPHLERLVAEAAAGMRLVQSQRSSRDRFYWNRMFLFIYPAVELSRVEVEALAHRLAPFTNGLELEQVVIRAPLRQMGGELRDTIIRISAPGNAGLLMTFRPAGNLQPMKPLSLYDQKVVKMRQRGLLYPYEIVKLLTPSDTTHADLPVGEFVEYDLDPEGALVPVSRPYGENTSNVVLGIVQNFTDRYPEGMSRVIVLGDPSRDLGAIAEPECRRIIAALDLAETLRLPFEWFPVSAGARISMESGVENMDWIARVLRRLVEFTQAGGEVNIIVNGINVGAQPYWNAEATMLMHTRGILIMTPKGAMVLTGKRALDYSGSVSAEDNFGIGGYDRIMGMNGQAQYYASDIDEACQILMQHYEHTYLAPGETFPRRAQSADPIERDVCLFPLTATENGFTRVGDIFSDTTNPGRKHSFDIRNVMRAASDQDHAPLERFAGMRAAESTVVWDAHLGGYPVCMIGIESKPLPRLGFVPADGPDQWTAGTLFPLSSKKVARAINAASNNRPVVILANLSGFDGSPESMRRLQLEFGAEIGRSVVNFQGPMIFCVISRYHGGAYVVFSRALNENVEVAALEGTYASVIGGAPAAAVVFAGEVEARARKDVRLEPLRARIAAAESKERSALQTEWNKLFQQVHSEKLGEVAAEFDRIHCVHRALEVGAIHRIIPPFQLRPYLVEAVERGIAKFLHERQPVENEHAVPAVVG